MLKKISLLSLSILFSAATLYAEGDKPVVLFDQGHNQRFLIEKDGDLHLSKLASIIASESASTAPIYKINDDTLSKCDAVIISGAFQQFSQEEINAVAKFVENGGKLAVMLHIGPPLTDLFHKFGVDISNMVIHEQENVIDKDINFKVKELASSPIFADLKEFSVYGVWGLNPNGSVISIADTSAKAWVDIDGDKKLTEKDAVQKFSIAVEGRYGKGKFVFFGDDAIFQNRYLDDNNKKVALNLAKWLLSK